MERKQDSEEGVQNSKITINGDDNHPHHHFHDDEDLSLLKREIACHSLYSLLVESHFNCLKLCLGKMENIENSAINNPMNIALPNQHANLFKADRSELDKFMEVYCATLMKLKEEMEEPQQESIEFINLMYSQLDDLLLDIPPSRGSEIVRTEE